MVFAARLSDAIRLSIADQIGQMLPAEEGFVEQELVLGESLPVRTLTADALQKVDGALRDATESSAEWHHQLVRGGDVAALTATSIGNEGEQIVVEVAEPPFAQALARAVSRLDEELGESDDRAELLIVPAYYLVAILLTGPTERVLVVDRPERLSTVEIGYLYPSALFVEALRRFPPAAGVPDRRIG